MKINKEIMKIKSFRRECSRQKNKFEKKSIIRNKFEFTICNRNSSTSNKKTQSSDLSFHLFYHKIVINVIFNFNFFFPKDIEFICW